MIWERDFKGSPKGKLLGTMYRLAGKRLFPRDARQVLENLEAGRQVSGSAPELRESSLLRASLPNEAGSQC